MIVDFGSTYAGSNPAGAIKRGGLSNMVLSKKDRRKSGWKEDINYNPIEFPYHLEYWDDWVDYRDGTRDANIGDGSKILSLQASDDRIPKRNKKNKMLLQRRIVMKTMRVSAPVV